jgi:hypothetical protein
MPWVLDPAVPSRVAAPFARGLLSVALEAAILLGWPIGWALASLRFVETGEARVLLALGEPPSRTALRLAPQGALFALLLAAVALAYGNDASAPGRVATELVARGRTSCARASAPATYAIPFTDMTWLCAPDRAPRLVGRAPGAMHGAFLSAADARIAGDFRALELDDARLLLASDAPGSQVAVHVASLSIRGMAPWAHASTLPAALRALFLVLTAWSTALLAAYTVLGGARGRALPFSAGHLQTRLGAIVVGALGPCTGLALVRLLERADARPLAYAMVPLAACAAYVALPAARRTLALVLHLRRFERAASTND